MTATGRVAWAKGQCHTTCSGAEGGLNHTGRSIAHGCKAGGKTCLVVRKDQLVLRFSYAAGDGARLRGGTELIEWRWPGGNKVACTGAWALAVRPEAQIFSKRFAKILRRILSRAPTATS